MLFDFYQLIFPNNGLARQTPFPFCRTKNRNAISDVDGVAVELSKNAIRLDLTNKFSSSWVNTGVIGTFLSYFCCFLNFIIGDSIDTFCACLCEWTEISLPVLLWLWALPGLFTWLFELSIDLGLDSFSIRLISFSDSALNCPSHHWQRCSSIWI